MLRHMRATSLLNQPASSASWTRAWVVLSLLAMVGAALLLWRAAPWAMDPQRERLRAFEQQLYLLEPAALRDASRTLEALDSKLPQATQALKRELACFKALVTQLETLDRPMRNAGTGALNQSESALRSQGRLWATAPRPSRAFEVDFKLPATSPDATEDARILRGVARGRLLRPQVNAPSPEAQAMQALLALCERRSPMQAQVGRFPLTTFYGLSCLASQNALSDAAALYAQHAAQSGQVHPWVEQLWQRIRTGHPPAAPWLE